MCCRGAQETAPPTRQTATVTDSRAAIGMPCSRRGRPEEVGDTHRQAQDESGLAARRLLLQGRARPFVAVARRQGGPGELLHGGDGLARGKAGGGRAVQHDGTQVVVADDRAWRRHQLDIGDRLQRHQFAARGTHAHAIDVVDGGAVGRLGLHLHLPGAAEEVKVVGVGAAHRRLQRREDVGDADAQRLRALAVELEVDLRGRRPIGREQLSSCGTCWAATISPRATAARSAGDAPASDCTTNSKPD